MQRRGKTALHAACEHGHIDVASLLLHHRAVIDSQGRGETVVCVHGEHGVSQNGGLSLE